MQYSERLYVSRLYLEYYILTYAGARFHIQLIRRYLSHRLCAHSILRLVHAPCSVTAGSPIRPFSGRWRGSATGSTPDTMPESEPQSWCRHRQWATRWKPSRRCSRLSRR